MRVSLFALLIVSSVCGLSQEKIQVKNIVDGTFRQESVRGLNWMNDGQFYSALEGNKVIKYEVATGNQVEVLVDGSALDIRINSYSFSDDESKVLLLTDRESVYRRSYTGVFYAYDIEKKDLITKISNERSAYATFSPSNDMVAYTSGNNLFITDLSKRNESITDDGEFNKIINGSTDWVYEEELYLTKAFAWSPDGKYLAYYKFDESNVREYNMQVWKNGQLYPQDYRYKYPKAGESNSKVEIWIYDVDAQKHTKADIGSEADIYIPRIKWTKDPSTLSIQRLNRLQNQLDILHVNAENGNSKVILTDKSDTYIDLTYCDDLLYLNDGKSFLFSSERSGYKHFYLYNMDGSLRNQITSGDWEAENFIALDQTKRTPILYFTSTEVSPLERHLYQIDARGRRKTKLTNSAGMHRINMSADAKYYMDYESSATTPLKVSLVQTRGNKVVKVLKDNSRLKKQVEKFQLAKKEFFTFQNENGDDLNGYFLKPNDFDASKKYPVLVYQYSGPGSQNVSNGWSGGHYIWHQMLVQNGYIVAVIDTRGTGGKGEKFKKLTYKELGKYETEDHISGAKYLAALPYIDSGRIGIWGWSYGGYISSLAMFKGADYFKTGIAVAPVTTWRFYDTIYTERYLQRPQDNPSGYDDNSPITHAEKLKGNYLLVHGTGDDNVHFQNSVTLQNKLIQSNKQFDSFYYPDLAHGLRGGKSREHLYQMLTDFILENL